MADETKKNRGCNFTSEEKCILVNLIIKYKDIIENKKTDSATVREKDFAWNQVLNEFNGSVVVNKRTLKQLKSFYDNYKRKAKKKNTEDKLNFFKTGGSCSVGSTLDQTEAQLLQVIRDRVEPLPNLCDSDGHMMQLLGQNLTTSSDGITAVNVEPETIIDEIIIDDPTAVMTESDATNPQTSKNFPFKERWKARHRPTLKKCRRTEVARVREKLNELADVRKELIHLEIQCLKEKHASEMELLKVQIENERLKADAFKLKIKYYNDKI